MERIIPIYVEGRDEPIVNKDHSSSQNSNSAQATASQNSSNNSSSSNAFASAESSSGPFQQHSQNPYYAHQNQNFHRPTMGFDDFNDIPMPHGSIFERAKDFPVRSDFNDFFNDSRFQRRSESPINQHHFQQQQQQQPRKSPSTGNSGVKTSNSGDRQVPIQVQHENVKRSSTPQRQQTPTPASQEPVAQQTAAPPPQQNQEQCATAAKQKAIEDSITKIQKIQQSVLELMSRVEKYNGTDRKEYLYLDEMLTQNLLKLDNIDAEGKENIKNARREAIKCINSLISLLEAKKDEAAAASANNNNDNNNSTNEVANQNNEEANTNVEQQMPPTETVNGTSKNSSYDNVNQIQQTSVPEKSAESSLEEKVANALNKQEG
ncbi:hypothetical protein PVAND_001981 [Polypedilum vanderplanki]|uniref:BAG domain-containing protein n=1 Tax=Polypedilum vanderplanki TaxID=319348 RepID=A0A9J6BR03_POLVA|nr:hypothetical protein PVAND_001981 [Polypedilum vanderplanki]